MRAFSVPRAFAILLLCLLLIGYFSACGAEAQGQTAGCVNSPNCTITQSQGGSTSNGQANPTSTPAQSSGPYGGTLLFEDRLIENADQRWQVGIDNDKSSCSFSNGGYDIKATNYYHSCNDVIDDFANFVFQVDMTLNNQSEGGVLFRVVGAGGYYFGIDDRGNYEMRNTNSKTPLREITDRNTLQSHYELTIVANGPSIDIYINGKKLDHFDDTSYTHGHIALFAGGAAPPNQPNTEVVFTNAKVWTL